MSQSTSDDPESDGEPMTEKRKITPAEIWRRSAQPANVTYRWIFASMIVGFSFVAVAIFAAVTAVSTDNKLTRDQSARILAQQYAGCLTTNERRAEAKEIAEGDVKNDQDSLDSDRANWDAIDALFPDGFPEPAWTTIQAGLDEREANIKSQRDRIEKTYGPSDCSKLLGGQPTPASDAQEQTLD